MEQEVCLQFDSVTCYGDHSISIIDFSFTLKEGENLVIFGPEDSGISLICPLIVGSIKDFEGTICYRGRSIKEFNYVELHNYRTRIGYVQSGYGLINNMTVEENILLPLRYHSQLSIEKAMCVVDELIEELRLQHCRNLRPVDLLKYETLNTAFARAVALDPDIILLEHPLENQCLINAQVYLRSLRKRIVKKGCSVIVVTYQPEHCTDYADTFIMLYKGNKVFEGDRDSFLEKKNPYLRQFMEASLDGPMKIL